MNLQDDDFTLFDLPRRMQLDRTQLDDRWRALQAAAHPDRFVGEGPASQRVAMQWAVRVNEAYRRLKDPVARSAYLCELRGEPILAESSTSMPIAFLSQQMEWREALDEAADATAVQALDAEVSKEQDRLLSALTRTLDVEDDVSAAAPQVRALMFVARFREDIHRRLEALDA